MSGTEIRFRSRYCNVCTIAARAKLDRNDGAYGRCGDGHVTKPAGHAAKDVPEHVFGKYNLREDFLSVQYLEQSEFCWVFARARRRQYL